MKMVTLLPFRGSESTGLFRLFNGYSLAVYAQFCKYVANINS